MSRLEGKVYCVTGGSRGAGFATAKRLTVEGAAVLLIARNRERLEEARDAIVDGGGRVSIAVADVADEAAVRKAVEAASASFGGLDGIVLNAAEMTYGTVESMELSAWEKVIRTNLTGAFVCAKVAIPMIKQRGGGHIIAVSSGAGRQGYPTISAYSASKFGLNGLMQALAAEVQGDGIKVSVISPGSILTEWGQTTREEKLASGKKFIMPEDVADAVVFLLTQPAHAWTQDMTLWPF